ncbi:MAG: segregation and condensation protein A [Minisyncoccia bacterium]
MMDNRSVHLQNLEIKQEKFSGPLDVLLNLIEERKMEITEVSLANVTDSFLKYVGDLKQVAPEILADFLVVAAKLILIKSRSLLPTLELSSEEEAEIKDLTQRLEVYRLFKQASQYIKSLYTTNPALSREFLLNQTPVFYPPEKFEVEWLIKSFEKIWVEFSSLGESVVEKVKKVIKIEEKINNLLKILHQQTKVTFNNLIGKREKIEIIVTFLALLQMFKQQLIVLEQTDEFGEIKISLISNNQRTIYE